MESMLLVFSSVPATPIYSNLQSLLRFPTVVGPAPLQSFRLNVSKALLSQLHLGLLPFSHPLYSLPNRVTVDSVSKKYLKSTNFSPTLCHPAGLVTWVTAVTLLHLLGFFPILFLKWKSATPPSPPPNPTQNKTGKQINCRHPPSFPMMPMIFSWNQESHVTWLLLACPGPPHSPSPCPWSSYDWLGFSSSEIAFTYTFLPTS